MNIHIEILTIYSKYQYSLFFALIQQQQQYQHHHRQMRFISLSFKQTLFIGTYTQYTLRHDMRFKLNNKLLIRSIKAINKTPLQFGSEWNLLENLLLSAAELHVCNVFFSRFFCTNFLNSIFMFTVGNYLYEKICLYDAWRNVKSKFKSASTNRNL